MRTKKYLTKPIDKRHPTPTQCNRIIRAQQRRAEMTPEQRQARRSDLRQQNGQVARG